MINLSCTIFERKRDVIQKVVGGASEILGKRPPYGSFALILNCDAAESAESVADTKRN